VWCRLLPLLQLLLLLGVSLRQLLCLLLVLLLDLLFFCVIDLLFFQLLVILVLLLLEFLPFLVLLRLKLLLLLLVLLVQIRIPRTWGSGPLGPWKVARMDCRVNARSVAFRARRFTHRTSLPGSHCSATFKFARFIRGSDRRLAVVRGSAQFRVATRSLYMFCLRGYGRDMPLMCGSFFLRSGARVDAAASAIEANAGNVCFVHSRVIHIVNNVDVYVEHRAVIEEVSVIPAPAFETVAKVTEAIVDPAVETHLRTPVTIIENVPAVSPTPIAGGPEKTYFRSQHPSSWHPEITVIAVSPVSGGPEVAVAGTYWLFVNRQLGRSDGYRYTDTDLRERCRGHDQHSQGEQQRSNRKNDTHCVSFCPVILRLPGVALLQRAAWHGAISGRQQMDVLLHDSNARVPPRCFPSGHGCRRRGEMPYGTRWRLRELRLHQLGRARGKIHDWRALGFRRRRFLREQFRVMPTETNCTAKEYMFYPMDPRKLGD
jgi:hypothetical protein